MKGEYILVLLSFFAITGCATIETSRHKYLMRGQVLEVSGSEAYICIGSAEGGKEGQEYTVYRYSKSPVVPHKQAPVFHRQAVGEVKITEIVDEHYAKARVLQGNVRVYDVVQLK